MSECARRNQGVACTSELFVGTYIVRSTAVQDVRCWEHLAAPIMYYSGNPMNWAQAPLAKAVSMTDAAVVDGADRAVSE